MLIGIVNKLLVKSSYSGISLSVNDLSMSELTRNLADNSVISVFVSTNKFTDDLLHQFWNLSITNSDKPGIC